MPDLIEQHKQLMKAAIDADDAPRIKKLMATPYVGPDDQPPGFRFPYLHYALFKRSARAFSEVLNGGADPDAGDLGIWEFGVSRSSGDIDASILFLSRTSISPRGAPLSVLLQELMPGDTVSRVYILTDFKQPANPVNVFNGQTAFHALSSKRGLTPDDRLKIADYLLEKADHIPAASMFDKTGRTPLHAECDIGAHLEIVKRYLSKLKLDPRTKTSLGFPISAEWITQFQACFYIPGIPQNIGGWLGNLWPVMNLKLAIGDYLRTLPHTELNGPLPVKVVGMKAYFPGCHHDQ